MVHTGRVLAAASEITVVSASGSDIYECFGFADAPGERGRFSLHLPAIPGRTQDARVFVGALPSLQSRARNCILR